MIDVDKIRFTVSAAQRVIDRLERAIKDYNPPRITDELYNLRRELYIIKQEASQPETGRDDYQI